MQSRIYIFIKSDNHSFHPEEWKGFRSEELCVWGSRIEFYYYSFIILGLVQQQIFSPWRSKFYCLDILPSYYKILWFCFVLYSIYVYFLLKVNRLFYWNKKIVFLLDFFCDLKYLIDIISRKYFDRIVASFKKYLLL